MTAKKSEEEPLRQRAEKLLSKKFKTVPKIQDKDVKALVHELQVHQVELEMQNDELRRAQAEIEESRTKYSDLYDFSPVGYFTFSPTGEIVDVNLTGASLLGIDRGKLHNRPFSAFVHPGFRSLFRDHRLNVLRREAKERCELQLIKKDGSPFHASIESITVRHGQNHRIRSAVSDITELKKAQEEAETEHFFRVAVENSILSGIAATDLKGQLSYVNLGFCRMMGRSEEELLGKKPPFAFWPPEEVDHITRAFQTMTDGKPPCEGIQLRFMRKNGERFDALVVPSQLAGHRGSVIGWVATFEDITHLKQVENELRELNKQLDERVRQRTAELETANEQLRHEMTVRKQAEEALRDSEGRLRVAQQVARVGTFEWNINTGVNRWTPELETMYGLQPGNFARTHTDWEQLIHPEDRDEAMRRVKEAFETGAPTEGEWRVIWPDGSLHWLAGRWQVFKDEVGKPTRVTGVNIDITERKQMEEELRKSRDELESRVLGRTRDLQTRMNELNCLYSISDLLNKQRFSREEPGQTLERILSLVPLGWQHPGITCARLRLEDRVFQTGNFSETPWKQGSPIVSRGKSVGSLEVFYLEEKPPAEEGPFLGEERRLIESIARQVGEFLEMKEVQEHLIGQARVLEAFFTATITPLVLLDKEFNFIRVNDAYAKACGRDISELIGRNHFELYPSEAQKLFEETVRTKIPHQVTARPFSFPDHPEWGVTYWDWTLTPALNPSGEVDFLIFSLNDVTERTRSRIELRENEELLRTILENLPLGVWITDRQERISFVNVPFLTTHGLTRDKVLGQRYDVLLGTETEGEKFRTAMARILSHGQTWKGHLTRKTEGGSPLELDLTISPVKEQKGTVINYMCVERDVTEEIRLQQQLRQMQKMEALGTLAGGIAHDFNNILMPVTINTELALLDAAPGSLLSSYLQLVLDAANRGKELVKQIITFSRQKEQERRPMDVVPLVKEALKFFRASIPSNIVIREQFEAASSVVPTDPSLIHQILMNLCTNAAHAMREQGGEMEVRLTNVEVDSKEAAEYVGLRPGPHLRLTVTDTGHGMGRDTLERVFDPFFTTKKPGEGTGMGLAVVHGIVNSHRGLIMVESEPGKGSTFHVYLPRMTAELEADASELKPLHRGSERILLIDDEVVQVQTVQYMLERLGYQVTGKSDAMEALQLFRSRPDAFDLVITDQTMPHLTGEKLARELLALRPDLPVLLCTGYSEIIDEEEARALGIKEFLMKPYAVGEIAEKLRRALNK